MYPLSPHIINIASHETDDDVPIVDNTCHLVLVQLCYCGSVYYYDVVIYWYWWIIGQYQWCGVMMTWRLDQVTVSCWWMWKCKCRRWGTKLHNNYSWIKSQTKWLRMLHLLTRRIILVKIVKWVESRGDRLIVAPIAITPTDNIIKMISFDRRWNTESDI